LAATTPTAAAAVKTATAAAAAAAKAAVARAARPAAGPVSPWSRCLTLQTCVGRWPGRCATAP
jgi:hypothetical protein